MGWFDQVRERLGLAPKEVKARNREALDQVFDDVKKLDKALPDSAGAALHNAWAKGARLAEADVVVLRKILMGG